MVLSHLVLEEEASLSQLPLKLWHSHVTWTLPISHTSEALGVEESKVREQVCIEFIHSLGWQGSVSFGVSSSRFLWHSEAIVSGANHISGSAAGVSRASSVDQRWAVGTALHVQATAFLWPSQRSLGSLCFSSA